MITPHQMTRQEFASVAARIAETASKWSGDVISDLREGKLQSPMKKGSADQFTSEIREYLIWIEGECNE